MIRLFGAALIIVGCTVFGISLGTTHRKEKKLLRDLRNALQEIQWELKFRLTELPELCTIAAEASGGALGELFKTLGEKLSRREVEDIAGCINALLGTVDLPRRVRKNVRQLGASLGRFDLEGQLQGLEAVRQQCSRDLKELEENSVQRLRNYQTLIFCGGAALAIVLI